MKKFLVCLLAVCMLAFGAVAFTACDEKTAEEGVTLVNISDPANEITPSADFDYMVAAEPAVSAKVKATADNADGMRLEVVGDLQALYGEDGYPQAVLVAKKSLIEAEPAFIASFTAAVQASCEWGNNDSVDIAAVVDAVSSHLPSGTTPTFSEKNLTASVIENCAISYVSAQDSKADVTAFLAELSGVGDQTFSASDAFYYSGSTEAGSVTDAALDVDVYMPDGAPALSMAQLLNDENEFGCDLSYNVVPATTIQTYVTGEDPQAEICVLPVNAAAKLLGSGENYQMLATLTHGNIYILSAKHTDTQITADNLATLLEGKRVGCIQLSNVVGLTLQSVLKANGIEYTVGE